MSTIDYTITDEAGDDLNVYSSRTGKLAIMAVDEVTWDFLFDKENARVIRDAINEFLDEAPSITGAIPSFTSPNEAKLRLAADLGLRAKFSYRGERDYRAVERRLVPDAVSEKNGVLYVGGESHDAGGVPEGYRQFRLDRISGEVVVR